MTDFITIGVLAVGFVVLLTTTFDTRSNIVRKIVLGLCSLMVLRYLAWRLTETLPEPGWTVTAVVAYGFVVLELFGRYLTLDTWHTVRHSTDRTKEADAHSDWFAAQDEAPLIDVLIPSYAEPDSILRQTILAARQIDYPNYRVWLLDDSRRDWVRELCDELGVNYRRRPDNRHFKAGNLNATVKDLLELDRPPQFLCILDADFIVRPKILRRLVALMHDEQVAIVQSPQHFYNPDPFQFTLRAPRAWPDDQRFLFDVLLPSLDASGVALCCGTSCLVRVSALRNIGLFPTESICEDTLMSYKFLSRGKRTVYLNEPLSFGLSPENLSEYLKQRFRWCLGTMQCVAGPWGPVAAARGPWAWFKAQALLYRWGYFSLMRYLWLSAPLLYWFSGISIIETTVEDAVSYTLPLLAGSIAMAWLTGNRFAPVIADSADLLASFSVIPATLRFIKDPTQHRFEVTQKGADRTAMVVHYRLAVPLLIFAFLHVLGVLMVTVESEMDSVRYWHYFWSAYAIVTCLAAVLPCFEAPKPRKFDRFSPVDQSTTAIYLEGAEQAVLRDVSITGAAFSTNLSMPIGSSWVARFSDGQRLKATVVRQVNQLVGLRWETTQPCQLMVSEVYTSDRYRIANHPWSVAASFTALLKKLLY